MAKELVEGDPGHKAVPDEEHQKQLASKKGYEDHMKKLQEDQESDVQENEQAQLTALDRLMRIEATRTFNLVCEDEDGEFAIPIRVLTGEQRKEVVKLIAGLGIAGASDDEDKVTEALDKVDEFAASLVTDPIMAEGIRKGKLTSSRALEIIQFSLEHTISLEEAGSSFRSN